MLLSSFPDTSHRPGVSVISLCVFGHRGAVNVHMCNKNLQIHCEATMCQCITLRNFLTCNFHFQKRPKVLRLKIVLWCIKHHVSAFGYHGYTSVTSSSHYITIIVFQCEQQVQQTWLIILLKNTRQKGIAQS